MATRRMTVSQVIVEFLSRQYTVDGDYRERTIPVGEGWWDVPIPPVSTMKSTQETYAQYLEEIKKQRPLLCNGTVDKK